MARVSWALRTSLVALCAGGIFVSCSETTSLHLVISTNVPYAPGSRVAIYAAQGKEVEVAGSQALQESWGPDGFVGTLTIVPARDGVSTAAIRVVLGVGRDPDTCRVGATQTEGCIIARRQLSFVRRNALKIPIRLHAICNGQLCDADTTCNALGRCVSAQLQCDASGGCSIEGDDAAGPLPEGGATDARADAATIDAAADTGDGDTGTDAGADAGPGVAPRLSLGEGHSCSILDQGSQGLKCWGSNAVLGDGKGGPVGLVPADMGAQLPFVDLGQGVLARQVSGQFQHVCARFDDGRIKCWGFNAGGLGLGDTISRGAAPGQMGDNLPYVDLGVGRKAIHVEAGSHFTCAVFEDGALRCWGDNSFGRLGAGNAAPSRGADPGQMGNNLPAVDLGLGRSVRSVALGNMHACVILDNEKVKCWGGGSLGQLGLGDSINRGDAPGTMGSNLPELDLGPGRTVKQLGLGAEHSCAVLDDGSLKCWGYNEYGALGLGDTNMRGRDPGTMGANLPTVDLGPGRKVTAVAAGFHHTCALLDTGQVKCWGNGGDGAPGVGDNLSRGVSPGQMGANLPPVDLGPGRTAREIACAGYHSCALLDDRTVKCWGLNSSGQLGLGDALSRGDEAGEMGASLPAVRLK
jgi:alpha-tubulin suppressor-like RCC1 family protein